ncbi:MAG: hypothetical protein KAT00_12405 [Planctomycetes bacterium]|nr:hypothetical protein [Planctomycetota bacterium]
MHNSKSYTAAMRHARIGASGPDSKDVQQAAAEWHAGGELRKLCDRVAQESTAAAGIYASAGARGGIVDRTPHYPVDPACATTANKCGGDVLGFTSLDSAVFPIPAPAAVFTVTTRDLEVGSETADAFRAEKIFLEFRSAQQNGAVVPGVLVAAFVGPAQQTIGAGNRNAISSGVWGSALDPVMEIGWAPFRNVDGQRLRMTLGAYTTANDLQVFGCLWGDAQLAYK